MRGGSGARVTSLMRSRSRLPRRFNVGSSFMGYDFGIGAVTPDICYPNVDRVFRVPREPARENERWRRRGKLAP